MCFTSIISGLLGLSGVLPHAGDLSDETGTLARVTSWRLKQGQSKTPSSLLHRHAMYLYVFHLAGCQTDSLVDSHSAFYGSYCRYLRLWFNIPHWDEEQLDRCVQAFQLVIQALGISNVSSMGYNPVCWPLEGPTHTVWCPLPMISLKEIPRYFFWSHTCRVPLRGRRNFPFVDTALKAHHWKNEVCWLEGVVLSLPSELDQGGPRWPQGRVFWRVIWNRRCVALVHQRCRALQCADWPACVSLQNAQIVFLGCTYMSNFSLKSICKRDSLCFRLLLSSLLSQL